MPVEPQLQDVLDQLNSLDLPPLFAGDPSVARQNYRQAALADVTEDALPQLARIDDGSIAGIPVRIYETDRPNPKPTVVFFHGGGWVVGDLDTHDKHCRRLAKDLDALVISVDYRLAPEHSFPAAFDDCFAVTKAVATNLAQYGDGQLAVAGDSAGGNLAAAVAVAARDEGVQLDAQLLIYPATDCVTTYPSRSENGVGFRLEASDMDDATAAYAGTTDLKNPYLSPFFADDHAGLAPAVIGVAGFDPLRDDGLAYAEKLHNAGVPVISRNYPTLIHGFYGFYLISPDSNSAVAELNNDLSDVLQKGR